MKAHKILSIKKICSLILLLLHNLIYCASEDPIYGKNGMVVSTSNEASLVGVNILKKGGNAIDAAVAVGFALAVTSSGNGNIGGGGFLVAKMASGASFTLDHREAAPKKSKRDMFLNSDGDVIPGMSLGTRASSGVPGTVDGLLRVFYDYGSGSVSLRDVLLPAIKLAEKGFKLSFYEANRFNNYRELFDRNKAASEIFIRKDKKEWKKGDLLIQKDLAKTLKRILKFGRDGFYSGRTAELIVKEMIRGNGLISTEDLKNYASVYREPIIGSYKDYKIISMGPPSSGGILLVNMLNMLENFQIDSMGWNSSEYVHLITEVERRAYADRSKHIGDPGYWNVPISTLTSKEYASKRIESISMDIASLSNNVSAGNMEDSESRETTHYSIVDKWGNAVSVTTTINLSYGNGIVVEGAGFFLNNEMDDFSAKPGSPNVYGLIGNEANSIEPNKRPLSSMTPTIVLKGQRPYMVIGSPGGSTIITTVLQCLLNVIEFKMDIKEAVSSPRFHSQWLPDVIQVEPRSLSNDVLNNLKKKGHKIAPYKWGYIGEANGILILEDFVSGGGDSRGETSAIGY
mgnify:FL=1